MSIEKRITSGGKVRYDVRLRHPNGRQYKRTFRTKREAEAFSASEMTARARGTWIDPQAGRMRFADWADEWFRSAKHRWRPRTADKHDMALRAHWLPRFGPIEVAALTPRQVQAAINELADQHSASSVRTYYGTLRACLRDAVDMDVIGRSPCRGINLPKIKRHGKRVIGPKELHRLADEVGPEWRSLIYLGGVMGLRFGEAAALCVQDVDFEQSTVAIARTVVDVNGRLEIDEPKTAAGTRTLVAPDPLLDELRAHIELFAIEGEELLFADALGGPLRRSNFRGRVFTPAVDRAGLDGLTFHGLRHSAATQWVANGVDARTVQHRLGHADPRLVLRLYAHAWTSADRSAAEVSSAVFWGDSTSQAGETRRA
ncbi:MAG: site-specific integrase [Actinomycetota bacterium]